MDKINIFDESRDAGDIAADLCEIERTPEACTMVIFGASGDLTHRKLMPALYNLFRNQRLPDHFCVVGAGRTAMDDHAFRSKMHRGLVETGGDLKH